MKHFENVSQMIEQIEKCKFEDEIGHPIENNVGYIELKELALKQEKAINELKLNVKDNTYHGIALEVSDFLKKV